MWRARGRKAAGRRKIVAGQWRQAALQTSGTRTSAVLQISGKPSDALGEALLAGGKAPADESLAFRPESTPGSETKLGVVHQPPAEIEAAADALDTKEGIHRAGGQRGLDARHGAERERELIAGLAKTRQRVRYRGFAVLDGDYPGALHENRRARSVVFDQLAEIRHQRGRRDNPPKAPPGHQPRLGKTVGADQAVVRRDDIEKR